MDAALIEAAITERTRAIMPVHLFGLPAEMTAIMNIARAHSLVVIEDAAQAIGARYHGTNVGALGDFGCFSFFPSKNLGGAGDGGCISTNDEQAAERLRMLRAHGSKTKYQHEMLGTNSRLDALQAAVLRAKLPHLERWTEGRRQHAERYRKLFEELDLAPFATAPIAPESGFYHVYNQFTMRTKFRDELKEFLRHKGVPTEIYYPLCLHLQPAFAFLGYKTGDCPVAEELSEAALSLPVCAELTDAQQELVVRSIAEFYRQKSEA
jgi:dTDP-4-amino-4,6-dideoxygalactose transaminase